MVQATPLCAPPILNRHERRRFAALPETDPMKQAQRLGAAAHERVHERMTRDFGNQLSSAHNEALARCTAVFSLLAFKVTEGRIVMDMPTGAGKTQSIVAWASAVHHLGFNLAATIAASHVEALCKIARDLREQGVPAEQVGVIHSKEYCPDKAAAFLRTGDYSILGDRHASEPTAANPEDCRFLLVSHQRVRGATEDATKEAVLRTFKGRGRDLLIWDEVMLTTAPTSAVTTDVQSGLAALRPYVEHAKEGDTLSLAMKYLDKCEAIINADWERQRTGASPCSLRLPPLGEAEIDAFKKVVRSKVGQDARSRPALDLLLTAAGQELRLALMGDIKSALLTYRVTVPPSMKNIAILDASHVVNRLVALDPTIRRDRWFHAKAVEGRHLKTYEDVTINFAASRSGRLSMEEAFASSADETTSLPANIVRTIAEIPEDEAVIVFTHKHKAKHRTDIPGVIRRRLTKAGIDPDARLSNGKPRVTILTWGQHTSLNEYAYAQNVVFAGVMHLDDETLLAWAVGQAGHLLTPLDARFNVDDIKRGDIAGALYQAISRGSCRFTTDGKANPMRVWLCHHDHRIKGELDRLMPGLTWADWEVGEKGGPGKAEALTLRIADHLRATSADKISNRSIKTALGLRGTPAATFTRAVGAVELPGWRREGQSFVREGTSTAYGFTS